MKKLILAGLSLLLCIPAAATQKRRPKLPLLEVDRAVLCAGQQAGMIPAWQAQLKYLKKQIDKLPKNTIPASQARFPTPSRLTAREKQVYAQRLRDVQKMVRQNPALEEFTFVAPVAEDLVRLSADNYTMLRAFFTDAISLRILSKLPQPFTLEVQVPAQPTGVLKLWMDVLHKEIYLKPDNASSADGK